jgi:hypothetical protein
MTISTALLAAFVPAIVTTLTGWVKGWTTFAYLSASTRTPFVRLIAAVLALGSVVITEWMTGAFDANLLSATVQTLLLTFGAWAASLGIFHGVFQSPQTNV